MDGEVREPSGLVRHDEGLFVQVVHAECLEGVRDDDLRLGNNEFAVRGAMNMRAVVDGPVGAFERGWRPEQSGEASAGLGLEWSGDSPQIHRVT